MATYGTAVKKVGGAALELGVYLPVGAALKARDVLLSRQELMVAYRALVDRGRDGLGVVVERTESGLERAKAEAEEAQELAASRIRVVNARSGVAPSAEELPIEGYDDLTAQKIVAKLGGLTQDQLTLVQAYEEANQNRTTVLQAIEPRLVDLPVSGYDDMTAEEITKELDLLSKDELRTIRDYESRTQARKTILERVESLLEA